MSLRIYEQPDPDTSFSVSGSFSNPFAVTCDGTDGFIVTKRLYVRNDDPEVQYSGISVQPVDHGAGIVDGTGWSNWKVLAGDTQPTEGSWATKTPGESVMITSGITQVSDTVTYVPFWVRVEVLAGAEVNSYQSVALQVQAYEDPA